MTKNFLVKKERFPIQIDTGCSIKSFTLEDTKSTVKMKTLFMFFALFTSFHMGKFTVTVSKTEVYSVAKLCYFVIFFGGMTK